MRNSPADIRQARHYLRPIVTLMALLLLIIVPTMVGAAPEATTGTAQVPALGGGNPLADTAGLFTAIFKVAGSLALVLGLLMLLVWWVRKMGISKGVSHQGAIINILDTRMIAPKKFVTVLEVGGECVVVGVTDSAINLLTRIENNAELSEKLKSQNNTPVQAMPFARTLSKALQNFNKKDTGKKI